MKALRHTLQKHNITRQWVGLDPDYDAQPSEEKELLQELEWQRTLTQNLTSYSTALESAVQSLLQAQQKLSDVGLELLCPGTTGVLQTLRATLARVRQGTEAVKMPLSGHLQTLDACASEVKRLEEARALSKHYEEKVEQLSREVERNNKAGKPVSSTEARLERNREKLQQAAAQAAEASQVAQRALRACGDRRPQLAEHARALTATMSSTLASANASAYMAPVATVLALPHGTGAGASISPSQVSPAESPNRFNPFAEEDEGQEGQEDNSLNPFAAEIHGSARAADSSSPSKASHQSEVQSHWTTVPPSESSEEPSNDVPPVSSLSPWAEATDTSAVANTPGQLKAADALKA